MTIEQVENPIISLRSAQLAISEARTRFKELGKSFIGSDILSVGLKKYLRLCPS